jgi:osmoprotectant transport system ATP-binding protein
VPAGEICVLVGPSGCGKTTAMRMVNRMIDITEGDILLDGESVKRRKPAELRRQIGYAIQQIGLFPHLTVGENIATVPRLLGWSKRRIRARQDELLELVSLDPAETRDRYPAQLSGGQRQRVGVARALAVDPPLMLMDEPFGAIDPINRERLQNEFLRLQAQLRKTVVFVTHDIDGALKRLALQRVRDVDLWTAPIVRVGEPVREARAKASEADLAIPLLVDSGGRPLGWLSEKGMTGERVERQLRSPAEPVVELDDVLRDALSDLIQAESHYAPVVDARGVVAGVLSIEVIGHALHAPPDQVPSGADALAE